tara:strand:+ start:5154 stop:6680 length:1527 start_codon:yes stop_codon:yes gene_type:complete
LRPSEINNIIHPHDNRDIIDYLHQREIYCTDNIDSLTCTSSIGHLESTFSTIFEKYTHFTGKVHYSNRGYHMTVPSAIEQDISMILGFREFPNVYKSLLTRPINDGELYISPESIKTLYNVKSYNYSKLSSQAVVEFLNDECFNIDDLNQFMKDNRLANVSITKDHFWGSCDPHTDNPDIEATLDIQYQNGVNNNSVMYYVSVSDWLYQFANKLYMAPNPPSVVSMSYGWAEWDQCDAAVMPSCLFSSNAEIYTKRTNVEFMKLGLRGITLVASSGDAGAPGRTDENCNSGTVGRVLNPAFPASSPWVLSVGGTIIENATKLITDIPICKQMNCIGGGDEVNCNLDRCGWTSGGGFSNYFNRPWWQINASSQYLNSSAKFPPAAYFNKNGRIYPDISLVSHNFIIRANGQYGTVDGTSASGPSVSAMVSILNNLRLSKGKATLGPINALLYHIEQQCDSCFNDIIEGSNNSSEMSSCKYGYQATTGYDAVYGLGTPNFDAIAHYVDSL